MSKKATYCLIWTNKKSLVKNHQLFFTNNMDHIFSFIEICLGHTVYWELCEVERTHYNVDFNKIQELLNKSIKNSISEWSNKEKDFIANTLNESIKEKLELYAPYCYKLSNVIRTRESVLQKGEEIHINNNNNPNDSKSWKRVFDAEGRLIEYIAANDPNHEESWRLK